MSSSTPKPRFARPSARELFLALLLAAAGALLGLGANALSPRGFDMRLAAGAAEPGK